MTDAPTPAAWERTGALADIVAAVLALDAAYMELHRVLARHADAVRHTSGAHAQRGEEEARPEPRPASSPAPADRRGPRALGTVATSPPASQDQPLAAPLPRLTVSIPEAGQVLGLSEQTVYRLMRTGEIPVVRFGRRTVIRVADLEDLLARRAAQTQTTAAAERTLIAAAKEAQQKARYRR